MVKFANIGECLWSVAWAAWLGWSANGRLMRLKRGMNQILIFSLLRSMPQPFVFIFSLPKVSCIVLMFCLKIRQTTNLILVQCSAQGQTFALQKWNFKSYFLAICTLKDMQGRFSSFQLSLYCTANVGNFHQMQI